MPKYEKPSKYPVSPLVDLETPIHRWEPGVRGGRHSEEGGKFMEYIRSKQPGFPPSGERDITPYFGKQWPQSLSAWRSSVAKNGYYMSIQTITQKHVCDDTCTAPCFKPGFTYRAIMVCLNPPK